MRTQRSADRALGISAGLLGVLALAGAGGIEREAGAGLAPRAFPIAIGLALLGVGAVVAAGTRGSTKDGPALDWPGRDGFVRIAVVLAATAVYVASLPAVGFPLASLVFVAGLAAYLGRGGWLSAAMAGLGTALVLYVVFIRVLGLSLPAGPLP